MSKTYKAKGDILFVHVSDEDSCGLGCITKDIEDMIKEYTKHHPNDKEFEKVVREDIEDRYTYDDCDLMSGIEFLESVLDGSITDYDGFIAQIFVDGYKSNLGLCTDNLIDGEFLVDEFTFRDICNEHEVEVNWANK